MKINKTELKNALEKVRPGLASKEIIEQTNAFAFMDGKVVTYNDEICISYPIELPITGAVKADELYALLGRLKKDEITVEVTENELLLTSGRTRAGIAFCPEVRLPLDEIAEASFDWLPLDKSFAAAVGFVQSCCSSDFSRPVLTGVHIQSKKVTASDAYRMAEHRCKSPIDGVIIPRASLIEALKLTPIAVCTGRGWVHFKVENDATFSCRVIEGKFPDTTPCWLPEKEGVSVVFPETIEDALSRVEVFAKADHAQDEVIEITCEGQRMVMKAKKDSGWIEEKLALKGNTEDFSFNITPLLFRYVLQYTKACQLTAQKIQFSQKDWKYLAMLKAVKN